MPQPPPHVKKVLQATTVARTATFGFLTGAGISSESGIPTFRGPEGYWTVGSKVYHPMELATHSAFESDPWEVWRWYLYRQAVCQRAKPNAGHQALTKLARQFSAQPAALMTQNVDGLHRRAGFPASELYEIHGHIGEMRCAVRCCWDRFPLPFDDLDPEAARTLPNSVLAEKLRCPRCGEMSRPHVLWFDEYYEETLFRSESALEALDNADILFTVGTSAATNLPVQTVQRALTRGAKIIDINPGEDSPFGLAAERRGGAWWKSSAGEALPALLDWFEQGSP